MRVANNYVRPHDPDKRFKPVQDILPPVPEESHGRGEPSKDETIQYLRGTLAKLYDMLMVPEPQEQIVRSACRVIQSAIQRTAVLGKPE